MAIYGGVMLEEADEGTMTETEAGGARVEDEDKGTRLVEKIAEEIGL